MNFELREFADTRYVPKKLSEQTVSCPVCNAETKLSIYAHDVPVVGTLLLFVLTCPNCGYRYRDSVPLAHAGKHVRITIKLNKPQALSALLYRSPYANVSIPELDIEINAGPANPGEITTPEALLLKLAETLFPLCTSVDNPEKCFDVVKKLVQAANGEVPVTLVIDDPSGLSTILKATECEYSVVVES
ncbi:MAG TPA: ZPR1 zinc finger domain-containing protein [Ignisphaera sp.]|nr:ZPR1 zinc finger domain-containing protein [Ignisphaera sp.]